MTQNDYRDDDQTTGQCPKCGRTLAGLTVGLRGHCEQHGWQNADFQTYGENAADQAERELRASYGDPGDEQVPASGNNPKEG